VMQLKSREKWLQSENGYSLSLARSLARARARATRSLADAFHLPEARAARNGDKSGGCTPSSPLLSSPTTPLPYLP
jgi:hypothetical protein